MAEISTAKALGLAQTGFKKDFKAILQTVTDQATGILVRAAGKPENPIPKAAEKTVIKQIGDLVQRVFVGDDGRSPFADDGVTPLAPYPEALNKWYTLITSAVILASQKSMKAVVKDADVWRWLSTGQPPAGATVGELLDADGVRAALLTYDPMHRFVGTDGLVLSQRIWRVSTDARLQVDRILADGIRNGHGALRIARALEQSLTLQPAQRSSTTRTPYNTRVSYPAIRLARTEITAAAGRATVISARLNPYVTGINWRLSPSHSIDKADQCDINAAGSPYAVDNVPVYPNHPGDLCTLTQAVTSTPSAVTADLRESWQSGQPAPLSPANPNALLLLLLGSYLYGLLGQVSGAT